LNVSNFVVQNSKQQQLLNLKSPKSNSICIPNIWPSKPELGQKRDSIFMGFQFSGIKTTALVYRLAKQFPERQFIMVGGPLDQKLF